MNKDLSKDFYRYVLPSMVSMLLSGFYSMVGMASSSATLPEARLWLPSIWCILFRRA